MMPSLGGFELLKMIRDDPSTHNMRVMMITARAERPSETEMQLRPDDFLLKPFLANELIQRVRVHVQAAQQERIGKVSEISVYVT